MDTEKIVEKKVYEDGGKRNYATQGEALGIGIPALVLGGVAAATLWGRGRWGDRDNRWGGGSPENVNILTGGATGGIGAPSAFQAWSKECDDVVALTNAFWQQRVNTLNDMYAHRDTDVNEKFGLYKYSRDSHDALLAKQNADAFGLYKEQRDNYDKLSGEISNLKAAVAVSAAVRPYQDKLIQCEIDRAFTAGINYVDRKTCRMISGEVVLPNTPIVTGYGSYNPCPCVRQTA